MWTPQCPAPQEANARGSLEHSDWDQPVLHRHCGNIACFLASLIFFSLFSKIFKASEDFHVGGLVEMPMCLSCIDIIMIFNLVFISGNSFTICSHTSLASRPSIIFNQVVYTSKLLYIWVFSELSVHLGHRIIHPVIVCKISFSVSSK